MIFLMSIRVIILLTCVVVGIWITVDASRKNKRSFGLLGLGLILLGAVAGLGGEYKFSWTGVQGKTDALLQLIEMMEKHSTQINENVDAIPVTNPIAVKTWWELLQYRIRIRLLLRDLASSHGLLDKKEVENDPDNPYDPSFTKLLSVLFDHRLISKQDFDILSRIKKDTHYFEWGTGQIPNASEVKFVLDNAPQMLRELGKTASLTVSDFPTVGMSTVAKPALITPCQRGRPGQPPHPSSLEWHLSWSTARICGFPLRACPSPRQSSHRPV
jgi:hypothetical protein